MLPANGADGVAWCMRWLRFLSNASSGEDGDFYGAGGFVEGGLEGVCYGG